MTHTNIGGASGGDTQKAVQKADSVQSLENRNSYETEEKKGQFIHESFKLDKNKILYPDKKLEEAMINLLIDNFKF